MKKYNQLAPEIMEQQQQIFIRLMDEYSPELQNWLETDKQPDPETQN